MRRSFYNQTLGNETKQVLYFCRACMTTLLPLMRVRF